MVSISMKELLESGVHFGHQTRKWNPKMKKYIFGERNGIYIIDLQKTLACFRRSAAFLSEVVAAGGTVLFVATKRQAQEVIQQQALRCGAFYVTHRWLGGTLTNFRTIRRSVSHLSQLDTMKADGVYDALPKKEVLKLEKERLKMERVLCGIREMDKLPAAVFVIDPRREKIAVREARKLGIPVVAVVDTNCDPDDADYVIPGNDDAIRAINLLAGKIADAVLQGKEELQQRREMAAKAAAEAQAKEKAAKAAKKPKTESKGTEKKTKAKKKEAGKEKQPQDKQEKQEGAKTKAAKKSEKKNSDSENTSGKEQAHSVPGRSAENGREAAAPVPEQKEVATREQEEGGKE